MCILKLIQLVPFVKFINITAFTLRKRTMPFPFLSLDYAFN